ncbi:MAG: hypothetical protein ACRYFW_09070 [Janthinobacterium lividum]
MTGAAAGGGTRAGRPLRFLTLVVGGWTGARAWMLWPAIPTLSGLLHAVAPVGRPADLPMIRPDIAALSSARYRADALAPRSPRPPSPLRSAPPVFLHPPSIDLSPVAFAQASMLSYGEAIPGFTLAAPSAPQGSRLSGSAWLLARGGPALAGGLAGAQLGGSQAGVRLAFAVDRARRLSVVGRLSTAIVAAGSGRVLSDKEGAVGIAWRPTRLPFTLVAEQRFVFDGGHGGQVLGAIAGLPPTPIAAGFRLEAYGQAGAIARAGSGGTIEGFGDGAARLTRPVTLGGLHLDVGIGTWGGTQRGAARLDVGPSLGLALPVARHAIRLTADWRERIAGSARPGSGPALSIGTDF